MEGDQFNLRWNNHSKNFIDVVNDYQLSEGLVDVTLSCEGQYVKAHRLILSACSEYFRSVFQVNNTVQHPFILLNGVRFKDLKYILTFMYQGEVKVLESDLRSVLELGASLQIKGLSGVKLRLPNEGETTACSETNTFIDSEKKTALNNADASIKTQLGDSETVAFSKLNKVLPNTRPNKGRYSSEKKSVLSSPNQDGITDRQSVAVLPMNKKRIILSTVQIQKLKKSEVIPIKESRNIVPLVPPTTTMPVVQSVSNEISATDHSISNIQFPSQTELKSSNSSTRSSESTTSKITNSRRIADAKDTPSTNSSDINNCRPPNAFMIFAAEWRKKLAQSHPGEPTTETAKRLGMLWKTLNEIEKRHYYEAANAKLIEFKTKFPESQTNANTSRKRKHESKADAPENERVNDQASDENDIQIIEVEAKSPEILCLSEDESSK